MRPPARGGCSGRGFGGRSDGGDRGGRGFGGRSDGGGRSGRGGRGGRTPRGHGRGGGGRGGPGMKGGSKVVVVPHKHDGVFITKAKEDPLCTKNMVAGESVYGKKSVSVQISHVFLSANSPLFVFFPASSCASEIALPSTIWQSDGDLKLKMEQMAMSSNKYEVFYHKIPQEDEAYQQEFMARRHSSAPFAIQRSSSADLETRMLLHNAASMESPCLSRSRSSFHPLPFPEHHRRSSPWRLSLVATIHEENPSSKVAVQGLCCFLQNRHSCHLQESIVRRWVISNNLGFAPSSVDSDDELIEHTFLPAIA
ncbi:uncharacterized protein LOC119294458 isoform X2 [Triticum dicoccoides]|uniref:uncharacterized protein LOC119294458 isoform X2 n=1 Tax=Triticum dicoccoides TaxID=85692 RepID=UPI00188E9207|nr:uncharacterized protein LOC119294458 isoform X2 [Triticum dicoccoides]XP_037428528.1 uncharacterized protein LOC119294458 isoform X2 [Triticum dicoccoides]XP_037428529.1 uncharacterized protein LOC119294458 isoform X2 [Triticum dicoccoides]XP_037428530.1 uncharacterized protein LOC119294458 isoform X2 [Triticum dicoccoides]